MKDKEILKCPTFLCVDRKKPNMIHRNQMIKFFVVDDCLLRKNSEVIFRIDVHL